MRPDSPNISEEALMEAARGGDLDAFDQLTRRLQPRLYAFAMRHLHNRAAAEDVTQESLLRLFRHRDQYRPGKRVSTWVFTIALNLCRDWFRRGGRNSSMSNEATAAAAEASLYRRRGADPLEQAEKHELVELLLASIETLPPSTRDVLKLRNEEGLTFEETARRLQLKPDAARAAASRAYRKLRKLLDEKNEDDRQDF